MRAQVTQYHLATVCAGLVLLASVVACGSRPSEADVRDMIAPSVVRVSGNLWSAGSGFLVEGNYIVTAAHVVWPSTLATIEFNDGMEHADVSVVAYDLVADLAFLGPVETSVPFLEFAGIEGERSGTATYSSGYTWDSEELVVNRGDLLTIDEWGYAAIANVSSTAEAQSGMSGGPMTNGSGEVIGVLFAANDEESVGTSSRTVKNRLRKIELGREVSDLGARLPPDVGKGGHEHEFTLNGPWDLETFVFDESTGVPITIDFETYDDVEYAVVDPYGFSFFDSYYGTTFRPARKGKAPIEGWDEPGFLVIRQRFDREQKVKIRSSVPLVRHVDPDDGRELKIGVMVAGVFDTPVDVDSYTISMYRDQEIRIRFHYPTGGTVTIDHTDALRGGATVEPEGEKATIEFGYRAPSDGEYTITVRPILLQSAGGYILDVSVGSFYDPKPLVEEQRPDGGLASPAGEMLRFKFDHPIPSVQIDYPADITGSGEEVLGADLFEQGRRGETLALEQFDLTFYDETLSIDQYVRRSVLANGLPLRGEKVTARREVTTAAGAPVVVEEFEADDGKTKGVRLAYIHEGATGFMAIFYAPAEVFDEWRPVVDYCIGTFSVAGEAIGE